MDSFPIAALAGVHVIAAIFWTGTMLLNAGFLIPAVRASGPAGGKVMMYIVQVRRLPRFLNLAVLLTLVSGAAMLWWVSGGLTGAWLASSHGMAISLGAGLTLAAAGLGRLVNAPTAARLGQLGASIQATGKPATPEQGSEMARLQRRLAHATGWAAGLLCLAAVAMATARYV